MKIFQYAESTEQNALDYYHDMADRAQDEGVKRVFNLLAEDETKLMQKLQLMLKRFPELAGLDSKALERLPDVFTRLRQQTDHTELHADLDVYRLARDAERDIVQHYCTAAEQEQDPDVRRTLHWIAALERFELNEIEQLFDFVNAPNESLEWGEFSNLDEFHNFGRYEDLRQGDLEPPPKPH